jgi:flagellar basal body-associated protein FliL
MFIGVLVIVGVMLVLFSIFIWFIFKVLQTLKPQRQYIPLNDLMDMLTNTTQRAWLFKYKLEYELKDIRMFHDFQKEMTQLAHEVLESLSPDILEELEHYHTRDYIIKYVTKTIQISLMEFIREKKIKTK